MERLNIQNKETIVINTVMGVVDILESLGFEKKSSMYVNLYESITETSYDTEKDHIKSANPYSKLKKGLKVMNENVDIVKSLNLVSFMNDMDSAYKKLDKIDESDINPVYRQIRVDINNSFHIKGFDTKTLVKPNTLHLIYNRGNNSVYSITVTNKHIDPIVEVYSIDDDTTSFIECNFMTVSGKSSFKTDVIYKLRMKTGYNDLVTIYTNPTLIGFKFTDSLYKDNEQRTRIDDIRANMDNVYVQKILGKL